MHLHNHCSPLSYMTMLQHLWFSIVPFYQSSMRTIFKINYFENVSIFGLMIINFWMSDKSLYFCITLMIAMFFDSLTQPLYYMLYCNALPPIFSPVISYFIMTSKSKVNSCHHMNMAGLCILQTHKYITNIYTKEQNKFYMQNI